MNTISTGAPGFPMHELHHPIHGSHLNHSVFDLAIFHIDSYVEFVP